MADRRRAIDDGLARRQIELLEQLAEAAGADVDEKEQCRGCGEWFVAVDQHKPHCSGP